MKWLANDSTRLYLLLAVCLTWPGPASVADDELAQRATWSIPTATDVRGELDALLNAQQLDQQTRAKIDAIWLGEDKSPEPADLLQRVTSILALVSDQAREVVTLCRAQSAPLSLPEFSILTDAQQEAFVRNNLRLLYGQWLAQNRFYDESLKTLDGLAPEDVVDPAALLFYQSASHHRMPDKNKCLPLVAKLLENEQQIPRRYAAICELIQADLEPLKTDSLDEISRLMDEVERRLDLKRAGKRVRDQEDEVLAKLDKLIKKLEEQQQQQSASAAGRLSSRSPAQDSMPLGGKGAGKVDPKSIGTKSGWGNLPPKDRQEALQQIGEDLPAHYREVIEEYFRKLAREGDAGS